MFKDFINSELAQTPVGRLTASSYGRNDVFLLLLSTNIFS